MTGTSGDINLTNHGTINNVNAGDNLSGPGNVAVKAIGGKADINISGQTALFSVSGSGSGLVDLEAGRDINLGGSRSNSFGAVRSSAGSILLDAGRNITFNPNAYLDVSSGNGTITVLAGGDLSMATSPASISGAPDFFTAGGASETSRPARGNARGIHRRTFKSAPGHTSGGSFQRLRSIAGANERNLFGSSRSRFGRSVS